MKIKIAVVEEEKLPENCSYCDFCRGYTTFAGQLIEQDDTYWNVVSYNGCQLRNARTLKKKHMGKKRPKWCPLITKAAVDDILLVNYENLLRGKDE